MKLRPIGMSHVDEVEGVFLTPAEYERHPAYHPFCCITRPTLFVTFNGGEAWTDVPTQHASRYALLEATGEDRALLWEAGYRMVNLERPGAPRCRDCGKAMPADASFFGRAMWHNCRPTCRHEEFVLCRACWPSSSPKCSSCGCEELYC